MQQASRRQAPGTKPEASERARTSGVGDDTTAENHSGALGRGTGWDADVDVGLGSAAGDGGSDWQMSLGPREIDFRCRKWSRFWHGNVGNAHATVRMLRIVVCGQPESQRQGGSLHPGLAVSLVEREIFACVLACY